MFRIPQDMTYVFYSLSQVVLICSLLWTPSYQGAAAVSVNAYTHGYGSPCFVNTLSPSQSVASILGIHGLSESKVQSFGLLPEPCKVRVTPKPFSLSPKRADGSELAKERGLGQAHGDVNGPSFLMLWISPLCTSMSLTLSQSPQLKAPISHSCHPAFNKDADAVKSLAPASSRRGTHLRTASALEL